MIIEGHWNIELKRLHNLAWKGKTKKDKKANEKALLLKTEEYGDWYNSL